MVAQYATHEDPIRVLSDNSLIQRAEKEVQMLTVAIIPAPTNGLSQQLKRDDNDDTQ